MRRRDIAKALVASARPMLLSAHTPDHVGHDVRRQGATGDCQTGAIKWIFGDPTKYWYTFPSLRAKALTLASGGLYPIKQHALSIMPQGLLMLFNDGLGSLDQPPESRRGTLDASVPSPPTRSIPRR